MHIGIYNTIKACFLLSHPYGAQLNGLVYSMRHPCQWLEIKWKQKQRKTINGHCGRPMAIEMPTSNTGYFVLCVSIYNGHMECVWHFGQITAESGEKRNRTVDGWHTDRHSDGKRMTERSAHNSICKWTRRFLSMKRTKERQKVIERHRTKQCDKFMRCHQWMEWW